MKKTYSILAIVIAAAAAVTSCNDVKREPGRIYMPDMAYSRAYESFAQRDSNVFTTDISGKGGSKIFFNNTPPAGTMKRGELAPYEVVNDSAGYLASAAIKNPYDTITLSKAQMAEAGRLYNVNCGICHGEKAGGNGPIAAAGHVGGVANLTLDQYVKMADGTMFHSITYGKGVMGSYASQVSRDQRWQIIKYIRTLQPKAEKAGADSASMAKK
jgi:mono/diheme cytochrome c family protein